MLNVEDASSRIVPIVPKLILPLRAALVRKIPFAFKKCIISYYCINLQVGRGPSSTPTIHLGNMFNCFYLVYASAGIPRCPSV